MTDKVTIEKGSAQETLIIPLYGRKLCTELFPDLFTDQAAVELCERLDAGSATEGKGGYFYDFSELDKQKNSFFYQFGALEGAMRGLDMQWEVKDYLNTRPSAAVVNMGCGLDQTGEVCRNGTCTVYNVDMPGVIETREQLLPDRASVNIASNLTDHTWMDQVDGSGGAVFFAAGVFHYLTHAQARDLVCALAQRFPGGRVVFDAVGKFGQRMMMRTVLRNFDMAEFNDLFYAGGAADIAAWSDKITVTQRGYMLGYNDMRDPAVSGMHRFLARVGDGALKMQIYRIDIAEG